VSVGARWYSMVADLLRRGTETRTATRIAEEIDYLGGALGASAGDDRLVVSLSVLSKDADTGLDLLADVIQRPTFPNEEIERIRQLDVAGLESLAEEPESVLQRVAHETVYAGHPYGIVPTVSSIKAITRDDLLSYYRRGLRPSGMILVAVGDFKTADITSKLRTRFGEWASSTDEAQAVPAVKPMPGRTVLIDKPDATQTYVQMVRTAFARKHPDYFAAQIAEAMLGGGFTSRLTEEIRVKRSLTYSIGGGFSPQLHGGAFGVVSFTKLETTRALLDAVSKVLEDTAVKGFKAGELKKVQGYLAGLFAIRVQTPEALAGELADMAFFGLPNDYLQTYLAKLRAVTLADANRVAKGYFSPGGMHLVMVAPAKRIEGQLKGLRPAEIRPVATVGK
jgi:zinc protease